MPSYLLAHDLGTTGNKATLYDEQGGLRGSAVVGYPVEYPRDGWVEQDPRHWWRAVCQSTKDLIEQTGVRPQDVACLCFSAQMMGCLLVDEGGEPLRPMITWADTRAAPQEKRMLQAVDMGRGYRITGHRISASYSAAKLLWVKDNERHVYDRAHRMLNAKDYIIHKLTGAFVTDMSDASGTNLMDLRGRCWSKELIAAFGIRPELLPELHPSTDVAGGITPGAAAECGLLAGTPVVLGGGDGSCACVGAGVVEQGRAYNVIGTSSWISYASAEPYFDGEYRTFNWVHLDQNLITPCGTMQAAGLSYHWFRDALGQEEIKQAQQSGQDVYELLNSLAATSPVGAGGLLFLPYLVGERSPRWNHSARGAYIGLSATSSRADMARALMEGVGYNLGVILDIFNSREALGEVVMIGGGAKGETWVQMLADIWQRTLLVPRYLQEATSMGAAICGGVGVGMYKTFEVCKDFNPVVRRIEPDPGKADTYRAMYKAFNRAYEQLVPVYEMLAAHKE